MSVDKLTLTSPVLIMLYGFPGCGKTFFARQLCEEFHAAHIQGDRIRHELFDKPRYDRQENHIVTHLMEYMAEELLRANVSVVFDINALRSSQRSKLRELASRHNAKPILVWFQIDVEAAFSRVVRRDRRKIDDKYSTVLDRTTFESVIAGMQNPALTENYMVISGKHTFQTQRSAVIKKLYDMGLLQSEQTTAGIAKPALVNLVPNSNGGRVDPSRRNIMIR